MAMPRLVLLLVAAFALAGVAAGCGGSDEPAGNGSPDTGEAFLTPTEAVDEIEIIQQRLEEAADQYDAGDAVAAEENLADTYLEHFELVEHPLEELDHDLMEDLEVSISTTLRNAVKEGEPAAQVDELVQDTNARLDEAKQLLESVD